MKKEDTLEEPQNQTRTKNKKWQTIKTIITGKYKKEIVWTKT